MARRLAVTRRAIRDLGLRKTLYGQDPADLLDDHQLIKKFVELRTQSPTGQERLLGASEYWNLHSTDPWRGETWFDTENDVVWLCAASDHDYDEFLRRHANGELAPSEVDYIDLAKRAKGDAEQPFFDVAQAECARLRAEAEASPGVETSAVIADEARVSVVVEQLDPSVTAADFYIGVQHPAAGVRPMPDEGLDLCVLFLVCPEVDEMQVDWHHQGFPRGGGRHPNETVTRWRRP